jgi:hypothetical protein
MTEKYYYSAKDEQAELRNSGTRMSFLSALMQASVTDPRTSNSLP